MNTRPTLTAQSSYTEICQRLTRLTTESICDAYPAVRLMDEKIVPIGKNDQCVGRAYTINSAQDSISTMLALDDLQPFFALLDCKDDIVPTIMMIASCGSKVALAGGVCARAAKQLGFSGVIIDGPYRDKKEIEASGLPFFAKGKCAKSGTKDKLGTTKQKMNCGGVEVNPGDIILADTGGIVVMDKQEAIVAIPKAEEMKQEEDIGLQKIEEEDSPFHGIFNIREHADNIRQGIPSKLKMTL
jgi:4-hydroxy-4-methyl-2-oxoglutarate aldolase